MDISHLDCKERIILWFQEKDVSLQGKYKGNRKL